MSETRSDFVSALAPTLTTCKQVLTKHYGDQLVSVILYGSAARHDFKFTSDIDLLVLLKSPFSYFQELRSIVDLLYPLQLEADHWISAKPAAQEDFEQRKTQLYRNIHAAGIRL